MRGPAVLGASASSMNAPAPQSAPPAPVAASVLNPTSVAALNARERGFGWGIKITMTGAVCSLIGSTLTATAAGWPVTLTGTAVVAVGLWLAVGRLPSQAFYNSLSGALDAKGRHQCVACGDRAITRPAQQKAGLWNRPKCRCGRCKQFLFVE